MHKSHSDSGFILKHTRHSQPTAKCYLFVSVEENITRISNETHANQNILLRKTHFGRNNSTIIEYNAGYYKTGNIDDLLISSRYAHTRDA